MSASLCRPLPYKPQKSHKKISQEESRYKTNGMRLKENRWETKNDNSNDNNDQNDDSNNMKNNVNNDGFHDENYRLLMTKEMAVQRLSRTEALLERERLVVRGAVLAGVEALKHYLAVLGLAHSEGSAGSAGSAGGNRSRSSSSHSLAITAIIHDTHTNDAHNSSSNSGREGKNEKNTSSAAHRLSRSLFACSALGVLSSSALLLGTHYRPLLLQVICLSTFLTFFLSVFLSFYLSFYTSFYLSIYFSFSSTHIHIHTH